MKAQIFIFAHVSTFEILLLLLILRLLLLLLRLILLLLCYHGNSGYELDE